MRRIAGIAFAAAALFALSTPAKAQYTLRQVPLGYCYATLSSATTLAQMIASTPTCTQANINATTYAVICAYVQAIVYKDDGQAPTSTAGSGGQGISAGSCIPYNGTFSKLQFIQQDGGAVVGVSLYK